MAKFQVRTFLPYVEGGKFGFIKSYLLNFDSGLLAFGLILIAYLCYLPTITYNFLPFDSGEYWVNGELFFKNGEFSLLNFNHKYRGYLLALLYLPFEIIWKKTGIELFVFVKVTGAFLAAFLFGILTPRLWEILCPLAKIKFWQRVLFAFCGFLFWRDYFCFTLSDFPALLTFTISLIYLYRKSDFGALLVAGIMYGATINIRPAYLACAPLFLLAICALQINKNSLKTLLRVVGFIVGIIIISLPQALMNFKYHSSISPIVINELSEHKKNLYLSQLEWGLEIQKYETSLDQRLPSSQLIFIDPVGQEIIKENGYKLKWEPKLGIFQKNINNKVLEGFGHYFKLVLSNPLKFSVIYLKHFFNGMDIQYATPYIQNFFKVNYVLNLANYTVLFCAILIFSYGIFPNLSRKQGIALILFLAPGILAIPTAIECRYLLPFHIFAYALNAFAWPTCWWQKTNSKQKVFLFAGYFVFLGICFLISSQIRQTMLL